MTSSCVGISFRPTLKTSGSSTSKRTDQESTWHDSRRAGRGGNGDGSGLPPAGEEPIGAVEPIEIQEEMERSFLEYSMSVIVSRALPDVRDGLKPVHRRILYSMFDRGLRPDRPHNKCAKVVGDVMGTYHPHGDSAIYEALARMVQEFSLRHPLIDGHGNFGGRGPDDGAAAMRYTECRLAPLALELMADIDEETVDMIANYDGSDEEPSVLRDGSRTCSSTVRRASRWGWPRTSRPTTWAR